MIAGAWILGEISDISGASDLATSGHGFTGQDLAQCGFAGAVAANKANPISVVDTDGYIFNEQTCPSSKLNTLGRNHWGILPQKVAFNSALVDDEARLDGSHFDASSNVIGGFTASQLGVVRLVVPALFDLAKTPKK